MKSVPKNTANKSAVSLFAGAGGMDVGFERAGFNVVWANDIEPQSCSTYEANLGSQIVCGDINEYLSSLNQYAGIDLVFGGPPCQGFSVAGKMDPSDERSQLVQSFMKAVDIIRPAAFVMENVKALATLTKFQLVREDLIRKAQDMGYYVELLLLNSRDFGVPQSRERMFLVGLLDPQIEARLTDSTDQFKRESPTVRDVIKPLGRAGTETNSRVCRAKITIAQSPVMRRSPYAGMMFNGQGRPLNPDSYSSTLHASMGGNKTPIVDEDHLYDQAPSWVEEYHAYLMSGGKPYPLNSAPSRLRRLTVDEAIHLNTFPKNYEFVGGQSSMFRQIGNAVPCNLAYAVGSLVCKALDNELSEPIYEEHQNMSLAI